MWRLRTNPSFDPCSAVYWLPLTRHTFSQPLAPALHTLGTNIVKHLGSVPPSIS